MTRKQIMAYDPAGGSKYFKQIAAMRANADLWRRTHPKTALISFNLPKNCRVICSISSAFKNGLIVTNDAGLELVKALWPWSVPTEPTILMVRHVIEGGEE